MIKVGVLTTAKTVFRSIGIFGDGGGGQGLGTKFEGVRPVSQLHLPSKCPLHLHCPYRVFGARPGTFRKAAFRYTATLATTIQQSTIRSGCFYPRIPANDISAIEDPGTFSPPPPPRYRRRRDWRLLVRWLLWRTNISLVPTYL